MGKELELGSIFSYNCRGLRINPKRKKVFKWLTRNYKGIIMLQETHTNLRTVNPWKFDLTDKYISYFSHSKDQTKKGGVCTIIPKKLKKFVIDSYNDTEGRYVVLKIEINNIRYALINVYFPTQDNVKDQEQFLEKIGSILKNLNDYKIVIGGDFNITLNPIYDRYLPKSVEPSKMANKLKGFMEEHHLCDLWRIRNPDMKCYTWKKYDSIKNTIQQSRLDMFLVSEILSTDINYVNIELSYLSDHTLISLHVNPVSQSGRGPGYWKFNTDLLNRKDYVELVKNVIETFNNDRLNAGNTATLNWDTLKMKIRMETIKYSKTLARNRRAKENELKKSLENLEEELTNNDITDDLLERYFNTKAEYEEYETLRTRGTMIRSKARWIEDGEKNSKYFMSLEKYNQELKSIRTLVDINGEEIRGEKNVLNYIRSYYMDIYDVKDDVYKDTKDYVDYKVNQSLNNTDNLLLDKYFTVTEISDAVKDLPRGKTPGTDGFNIEFYQFFWNELRDNFMKMLADVYINEKLSIDQRRGIISLIPKQDKDLKFLTNWRPISILNTDYKIITKALANRLKPVLPDLISEDQNGFVLGRLIGQNIRIVKDLMDYCQAADVEGLLVLLDFEKAFDSLSWPFIQYTLRKFNFGENFIKWISIIYTDISSSVSNNGFISESFPLKRGIRQGCPISAFIFILCAELLAIRIKESNNIVGLDIGQFNYKILQFADDTALIVKDVDSLQACMNVLTDFYKSSGLRLNKKKTIVVTLGNGNNDETINQALQNINLNICNDSFRYLGIWFDKDENTMEFKNFRHRLENMRNLLQIWLQRDLSLKGKVTVLKTLAMSKLIFPLSMLSAPGWVIEEADKMFLKFLWDGKPRKVKKLTTEKSIAEGGLAMVNIDYMARALKASWVSKICINTDNKWMNIPKMYFSNYKFEDFCQTRFDERSFPISLPSYYRQCLIITDELRSCEPNTIEEVKGEYIWFNKNITVSREPVFYPRWYNHNIKIIGDLLNDKNDFMTADELQIKYNLPDVPFLDYYGIRNAIPYNWRNLLKSDDNTDSHFEENKINILLDDTVMPINGVPNKALYWQILKNNNQTKPTATSHWQRRFNISDVEMSKIYCLPYRNVRDVKIQSMQYKILTHIYICRLKLYQWKIDPSDSCLTCGSTDNLEHHFYNCVEAQLFWHSLNMWWSNICNECSINSLEKVIFGIYNKECHHTQLNYINLKAKWYIFRTKYLEEHISFLEFLPELKKELLVEEIICRNKKEADKFYDKWYDIITMF
jgi:exonuclease III